MKHREPIRTADEALSLARILSDRSARDKSGLFWIEGVRSFIQAHDAGYRFKAILYADVLQKSQLAEMLARRRAADGVPRFRFTPEQFRSVSLGSRASGIGAIAQQRWIPLPQFAPGGALCTLILERVRSPGNLGTILRTAEACGVGGVVFVGPDCDPYEPAIVQASMGGLFHLPLVRTAPARLAAWLCRHGVTLLGLSPVGQSLWSDVRMAPPLALAIGEERSGLSLALRALSSSSVRLPMTGRADSLNVGVATGVMLYELRRRHAERQAT